MFVEEARFIERDNSFLVTLRENEGRRFTAGLRGDIENKPESSSPMTDPLNGVRIIDLTAMIFGPLATMMLAELRQENIDAGLDLIQSMIKTESTRYWLARLEEQQVSCARPTHQRISGRVRLFRRTYSGDN